MALAIWKRLPANRRDEVLKRMSDVGGTRLDDSSGVAGKESAALQQLNRRMQIGIVSVKPGVNANIDRVFNFAPSDAGSSTTQQTIVLDTNEATAPATLSFVGYGAAAQTKTYPVAVATYTVVLSDAANAESRALR